MWFAIGKVYGTRLSTWGCVCLTKSNSEARPLQPEAGLWETHHVGGCRVGLRLPVCQLIALDQISSPSPRATSGLHDPRSPPGVTAHRVSAPRGQRAAPGRSVLGRRAGISAQGRAGCWRRSHPGPRPWQSSWRGPCLGPAEEAASWQPLRRCGGRVRALGLLSRTRDWPQRSFLAARAQPPQPRLPIMLCHPSLLPAL